MPYETLEQMLLDPPRAASTMQRLNLLEAIVERWHGPISRTEGLAASELDALKLPMPLRWWYERFGRRTNILSRQNWFLAPAELRLEEDDEAGGGDSPRLVFWQENQAVYIWSTEMAGADPPVWMREYLDGEPWEREESRLSEFLIGMVLFEAIMHAPSLASAAGMRRWTFEQLAGAMRPVPLPPWRWPIFPHRFYVRGNALMFAGPSMAGSKGPPAEAMLGAKTADDIAFVHDLDVDWDVIRD